MQEHPSCRDLFYNVKIYLTDIFTPRISAILQAQKYIFLTCGKEVKRARFSPRARHILTEAQREVIRFTKPEVVPSLQKQCPSPNFGTRVEGRIDSLNCHVSYTIAGNIQRKISNTEGSIEPILRDRARTETGLTKIDELQR